MGGFSILCHELRRMQSAYMLHANSEGRLKRHFEAELLRQYFSKRYHFSINEQLMQRLPLFQLRQSAAVFLKMNEVSMLLSRKQQD